MQHFCQRSFSILHSAFCIALAALTAASAKAAPKVMWEESVADADSALVLVGDVREGAALVVGPVTDPGQFESLADEFGPNGVPVVGRDKNGRRTLGLGGCREWERPAFSPDGLRDATALLRLGRGLVVLTTYPARKLPDFTEGLLRELALQNAGVVFKGVSFLNAGGKKVGQLARGEGKVEISLLNLLDAPATVSAELTVESSRGRRTFAGEGTGLKKGAFKVAVEGDFLDYGPTRASLSFTEKRDGKTYSAGDWTLEWPKYFSVRLPEYRAMVSAARREAAVHLGAAFDDARAEAFAGRVAEITVAGPGGAQVAAFRKTFGESPRIDFDAPLAADAPAGEYRVRAVTTDGEGREIHAEGVFRVVPVRKGQVFVDQDGGLLADGRPWYPFGLYHVSTTNDVSGIAALGVDLCQMWSDNVTPAMIGHLRQCGVRLAYETDAWPQVINTWQSWRGKPVPLFPFETNANFRANAELVKSNPDILAFWYTSDEGGGDSMRGITKIRKYWQDLDPEGHPAYLVTTREDPALKPGADIFGLDCYPRSFGAKRPMTLIADLIDKLYAAYPAGNCVLAVPQAFGHSGKGRHQESPEEFACMSYLCMVHGAKGLFWYCWWDGGEQGALYDANLRAAIKQLTTEAKEFKLALLVPGAVTFRSADDKVHARLCGDAETGRFLIAINGSDDPSDDVLADSALKGLKLEPLFDTPAAQPDKDGQMKVSFAGAARAVWRVLP